MEASGKERRREPRAQAEMALGLGPGGAQAGRLKNLSRSGLCCVTSRPLPEMSLAEAHLLLPGPAGAGRNLRLEGAVVRCRPEPGGGWEVALFLQFPPEEYSSWVSGLLAARE